MASLQFPGGKGFIASMESGIFKLNPGNRTFRGLRSFTVKEELGGEAVYGNGPKAIGRTIGQYKASADIEQNLIEYSHMVSNMSALGVSTVNLTVTWREGVQTTRVEIVDGLIKNVEMSSSQGGGAVTVKYTLDITEYVKTNGKTLIDEELLYRGSPRVLAA